MSEFISFQLSPSTAEVEAMYFYGVQSEPVRRQEQLLPAGTYRVIAGELFRLVAGVPPEAVEGAA